MRNLLRLGSIALACLLALVGCEGQPRMGSVAETAAPAPAFRAPMSPAPAEGMVGMMRGMAPAPPAGAADQAPGEVPKAATAGRKIVYNASVDVVTPDLNALEAALLKLVAVGRAYVADSDRTGTAGATRRGSWKVRVPVEGYDAFLRGAVALGELVSVRADSQDVSEEFFDLEAREKAKKVEEERLLKHLADSTGKLEEILAVERELSRVRGEIERMQGRLRVLANLTSLATVTVTASEIQNYVPPRAPTLATRVGRTFRESLASLGRFGEAVLLALVAIAPWLPLILVGVGLAFLVYRRVDAMARRALARSSARSSGAPR